MKQPKKHSILNILMLTVAGMVNAFGVTIFLTPVNLYDSGISGTSMLLEQITPSYLTLSVFLLILNIPMFLIGLKNWVCCLLSILFIPLQSTLFLHG